jgi:predicted phage terminase large subunit-like protein
MRYEAPVLTPQQDGTERLVSRMQPTTIGWTDPRTVDGELLWPAKYPEDKVANLEIAMGLYGAAGQLQQRPSPRGGGKFKREWFGVLTTMPHCAKLVRYWDKAGTKDGKGARTATVLCGVFSDASAALAAMKEKYVFCHAQGYRVEAAEREAIIKQTAASDAASYGHVETWVEQEPGSGGKESAQGTVGNLAGFTCNIERVTGSKEVRADPLSSQASVGKVKLLAGKWNGEFLDELEQFPMGKLKDMVDAGGGAFNKLAAPGGGLTVATLHVGRGDAPERPEFERVNRDDFF